MLLTRVLLTRVLLTRMLLTMRLRVGRVRSNGAAGILRMRGILHGRRIVILLRGWRRVAGNLLLRGMLQLLLWRRMLRIRMWLLRRRSRFRSPLVAEKVHHAASGSSRRRRAGNIRHKRRRNYAWRQRRARWR